MPSGGISSRAASSPPLSPIPRGSWPGGAPTASIMTPGACRLRMPADRCWPSRYSHTAGRLSSAHSRSPVATGMASRRSPALLGWSRDSARCCCGNSPHENRNGTCGACNACRWTAPSHGCSCPAMERCAQPPTTYVSSPTCSCRRRSRRSKRALRPSSETRSVASHDAWQSSVCNLVW